VGAELLLADGQTGRQTDMPNLIIAFSILRTLLKIGATPCFVFKKEKDYFRNVTKSTV
jgi:hypothetical protein